MEDDEAFNAGRGSKLTVFGHVEMDASIMEVAGGDGDEDGCQRALIGLSCCRALA